MGRFIQIKPGKKDRSYTLSSPGDHVFFLLNASGTLQITLTARNARAHIFGMYVGKNNDQFDIKTVQHHGKGATYSDLLIKGAFFQKARFSYEGLIRIEKGADGAHAYQKNQNLMMSDACYVDSRPFLEILANDVFCTHGSTTGRVNPEELYYLATRGIAKKNAERLLIEGFFGELFERMEQVLPKKNIHTLRKKAMTLLETHG